MGVTDSEEPAGEPRQAREGLFDAQLTFSAPFIEAPPPLTTIIKRDGSTAPFDKHKIANAILRAAQTIGNTDRDRAASLASAVTIYLTKKLNGETPTVDQVDDAVEKVLIEMGHGATALAYARYRDRRARVRSLRQGDARALLSELEEARRTRDEERPSDTRGLFVRTSAETLASWNRDRIADALIRETRLDEAHARLIAMEVEQQIVSAHVKVLTTSLIRGLVGAKLIEHGLEEYHHRHMRLGVPLYDAERIIRGPSVDGTPLDPEITGRILAESVKREFALTQVFSPDVAEAHVRGDLHLHDLGCVDRLHSGAPSLEYITRFGVGWRDSRTFSKPPKYPDTLLAHMVHWHMTLQNHLASLIRWEALNVFFAPFLHDLSEKLVRQVAQMLVYEFASRATADSDRRPVPEIGICWDVPRHLQDREAVGPGGAIGECSYGDFAHAAQTFAWALFDVLNEGVERGAPFPAPLPVVHVTPNFFKEEGHEAFLDHVARAISRGSKVYFLLERETSPDDNREPWVLRDLVAHRVTLNLARAAYRGGNTKGLLTELERLLAVAARAHAQKADFIEQLLSPKNFGPLALLTAERDGEPYLHMQKATYLVGLTGLNECVQYLTGDELHESLEAEAAALRILAYIASQCEQWSRRLDLRCVPAHTVDAAVADRFALIDLQTLPGPARSFVKTHPLTHDIFYTPGLQLNAAIDLSPIDRVRLEGQLHECVPTDALTHIHLPDTETSHRAIADSVRKTFHHTRNRRLLIWG